MATLNGVQSKLAGTVVNYVAAGAGGDKFLPGDHRELCVRNGGGAPITVSIAVPGTAKYGGSFPVASGAAISVAAGAEQRFGPFPADLAQADGLVSVTYSGVTSVTVAVVDV